MKKCSKCDKVYKANQGNISRCCRGNYKTNAGFIWKYAEESNEETQALKHRC